MARTPASGDSSSSDSSDAQKGEAGNAEQSANNDQAGAINHNSRPKPEPSARNLPLSGRNDDAVKHQLAALLMQARTLTTQLEALMMQFAPRPSQSGLDGVRTLGRKNR